MIDLDTYIEATIDEVSTIYDGLTDKEKENIGSIDDVLNLENSQKERRIFNIGGKNNNDKRRYLLQGNS